MHGSAAGCVASQALPQLGWAAMSKLDARGGRGQKGVFVGYDTRRQCYRVRMNGGVVSSRDVVFDETAFTYLWGPEQSDLQKQQQAEQPVPQMESPRGGGENPAMRIYHRAAPRMGRACPARDWTASPRGRTACSRAASPARDRTACPRERTACPRAASPASVMRQSCDALRGVAARVRDREKVRIKD